MNATFIEWIFWGSMGLLAYAYLAYPILIVTLARLFSRPEKSSANFTLPSVTVILCAFNEEQRIRTRLQNLIESDYPADKMNIIVVSDGSTDSTADNVRSFRNARIQLLDSTQRVGKSASLNRAVENASNEIIVFCDTRQRFEPSTISRLIARFSNPKIGAVSGALEINPAASTVGGGIDAYWRIEKLLRRSESRFDSCIGCTGAVYAIRRNLFRSLSPGTLLDDVVIPMQIVEQGYRVAFEPSAVAYDAQTLEPEREKIRKRRTLAGNYQMLFQHLRWLLPWRNRTWWMLISHKYLRLAAPFLMLAMLVSNFLLLDHSLYRAMFLCQCLFYLMAGMGLVSSRRVKLFAIPAGFVFLNWMAFSGLWHYFRLPAKPTWEKASNG